MLFNKIETKKVYENVITRITDMIVEGKLAPGDYLPPERELAEQLGVSRPSLREALRILQVLGIIKNSPKTGTVIQQANAEQIFQTISMVLVTSSSETNQLLEVRKSLETEICYYAAIRRDEKDLQLMESILKKYEQVSDAQEYQVIDYEFHYAIACATKNEFFKQIFEMISNLIHKQMVNVINQIFIKGLNENILIQHKTLFKAIKDEDAEKARLVMREHMEFAEEFAVDAISLLDES